MLSKLTEYLVSRPEVQGLFSKAGIFDDPEQALYIKAYYSSRLDKMKKNIKTAELPEQQQKQIEAQHLNRNRQRNVRTLIPIIALLNNMLTICFYSCAITV